jgi:hypothetical protein
MWDTPTADLRVDFGRVGMARLSELTAVLLEAASYSAFSGHHLLRDFSFEQHMNVNLHCCRHSCRQQGCAVGGS